jgi:hypothetical protein
MKNVAISFLEARTYSKMIPEGKEAQFKLSSMVLIRFPEGGNSVPIACAISRLYGSGLLKK